MVQPRIARDELKPRTPAGPDAAGARERVQLQATDLYGQFHQRHGFQFQARAGFDKATGFTEIAHPAPEESAGAKDQYLGHRIAGIPGVSPSIHRFCTGSAGHVRGTV